MLHEIGEGSPGAPERLADTVGVKPRTMRNWFEGRLPDVVRAFDIAEKLDVSLEQYAKNRIGRRTATGFAVGKTMAFAGSVSAGTAKFSAAEEGIFPSSPAMWGESKRSHLVDSTKPLVYIRVAGDSMSPSFPDRTMLACGRSNTERVPDLTPVIARIGAAEHSFKLFVRHGDEALLIPINRSHKVQRYELSRVTIEYIVLGQLLLGE